MEAKPQQSHEFFSNHSMDLQGEVKEEETQGKKAGEKARKMGRTPCCDKEVIKKGIWSPEEDKILVDHINKHGCANWRALPKQAGLLRCGKSCRLRWLNYLRPDIKRGPFSQAEQISILQLHSILGNKWAAIASHFPGRTDNEIKNFWNTHLRKRVKQQQQQQSPLLLGPLEVKKEPSSSDPHQMVQFGSATQIPEGGIRFSMDDPLMLSSFLPVKHESDYFLRIWNSGVGQSFLERGACQSPLSQVSSSTTKDETTSGVTEHIDAGNQKHIVEPHQTSCKDSDNSKSYEMDVMKQPAPELTTGSEMDFLQECVDDVAMYLQEPVADGKIGSF